MDQLPKKDQEVLKAILLKQNPNILSQYEKNFLNARRSYLTPEHRRIFGSILVDENTDNQQEQPSTTNQTQTQYIDPAVNQQQSTTTEEKKQSQDSENPYDVDPSAKDGSQ